MIVQADTIRLRVIRAKSRTNALRPRLKWLEAHALPKLYSAWPRARDHVFLFGIETLQCSLVPSAWSARRLPRVCRRSLLLTWFVGSHVFKLDADESQVQDSHAFRNEAKSNDGGPAQA